MALPTTAGVVLQQIIPCIPDLSGWVSVDFATPNMVDGDTFTYQGTLHGRLVMLKRRRFILPTANNQVDVEAMREACIWFLLDHVNIHPFLGIVRTNDNAIFTVAEWIENGNAHDYVRENNIDPSYLLLGVARALTYLHSHGIYHGYVRAKNVLVSRDGNALLTAFFCSSPPASINVPHPVVSPPRWMAPEGISDDNHPRPSGEMDVWAFGMTALELFTRTLPFEDETSDKSVMIRIVKGLLPGRPPCMTERWWELCTSCWNMEPALRPNMSTIVDITERTYALSMETKCIEIIGTD